MVKKSLVLAGLATVLSGTLSAEEVPQAVYDLVPTIELWVQDSTLVDAVATSNKLDMSQAAIDKKDQEWQAFEGVSPVMEEMLNNEAAKTMAGFESSQPYYIELFLTDAKGANVAMTSKTSDYWQGDEEKFTAAFADNGQVFVGPVEFDDSAGAYLVQVSVPVRIDGAPSGVLVVGINLDMLE